METTKENVSNVKMRKITSIYGTLIYDITPHYKGWGSVGLNVTITLASLIKFLKKI